MIASYEICNLIYVCLYLSFNYYFIYRWNERLRKWVSNMFGILRNEKCACQLAILFTSLGASFRQSMYNDKRCFQKSWFQNEQQAFVIDVRTILHRVKWISNTWLRFVQDISRGVTFHFCKLCDSKPKNIAISCHRPPNHTMSLTECKNEHEKCDCK